MKAVYRPPINMPINLNMYTQKSDTVDISDSASEEQYSTYD